MRQGDSAGLEVGEHRLDVAQHVGAGGRIAGVADRAGARQALGQIGARKRLGHVTHVALGVEALAIEGGDAAGLLAAMLQGVQAQRGDLRGAGCIEDAEDAAFQP